MPDKKTSTLSIAEQEMQQALLKQTTRELGTSRLTNKREILLLVRGEVKRVLLAEESHCLLGRFDKTSPSANHVNLAPYDAETRTVSRIHAQLHVDGEGLYLTDLGSTNGTYVNSSPLIQHVPHRVRSGDEVFFGHLPVQIMFQ